jgi:hypothetical protein
LQIHENVGGDAGFWQRSKKARAAIKRAAKPFTARARIQRTKKTAA